MLSKPLEEIFPDVPDDLDLSQLDLERIPQHVAVIMDGNGRWAKKRGSIRLAGHKAGIGPFERRSVPLRISVSAI